MRYLYLILLQSLYILPVNAQPLPDTSLLPAGTQAAQLIRNVDRSVTIKQPTVWINGSEYALSVETNVYWVCRTFGFHNHTDIKPSGGPQTLLPNIRVLSTNTGTSRFERSTKVEDSIFSITCSNYSR